MSNKVTRYTKSTFGMKPDSIGDWCNYWDLVGVFGEEMAAVRKCYEKTLDRLVNEKNDHIERTRCNKELENIELLKYIADLENRLAGISDISNLKNKVEVEETK